MVEYSPLFIDILGAFLIVVLGLILANILSNVTKKIIKNLEVSQTIKKEFKIKIAFEYYVAWTLKLLIYFLTFILVFQKLGIPAKVLWVIFILVIIVMGILLAFGFKDIVPNIVFGFYIKQTKKIKAGETIKVMGVSGKIRSIALFETRILNSKGEVISVPHHNVMTEEIIKNDLSLYINKRVQR